MTQRSINTSSPEGSYGRRTDPARDRRRLILYFGVLLVVYLGALILAWPDGDADPNEWLFLVVMYAPLAGALAARYLGPGIIQWGRPSWWILAGLIPPAAVLGVYLLAATVGIGIEGTGLLSNALIGAAGPLLLASMLAFGEEVGWRGFLWPLLRTRYGFLLTALAVGVVWWIYHVPFVFLGWYGTVSGLPAFTVALAGFTLFVGVITDRSRSVWPSVLAHGGWNALVATTFAVDIDGSSMPAFKGANYTLGEFGWLPAITMLLVGAISTWWNLRTPAERMPSESTRR